MIRVLMIGAAIIAALAAPAFAGDDEEVREYRSHAVDTGAGHQGREYRAHGVLVVEGAPRWSEYRQTSVTRRHGDFDLGSIFQYFD
jgi:hypothetical protein